MRKLAPILALIGAATLGGCNDRIEHQSPLDGLADSSPAADRCPGGQRGAGPGRSGF
jgi:hypothetical protein